MSRFFVKYDSDSSSEEEDLLSSDEEEALVVSSSPEQEDDDSDFFKDSDSESDSDSDSDAPKGPSYFLKRSFLKGGNDSDSDSDGEDRRVVKSAKEKLFDDIKETIDKLEIAKLINNWINALNEFDKLGKLLTRSHQQNFGTPNFYIIALADLEDFVNEANTNNEDKDKKKIPADQSRAFNTLRQRVKRHAKEFQALVDLRRESPELFESEDPVEVPLASGVSKTGEESGFAPSSASRNLSPVFTTLKQISESRGKRNIDKFEQIQILETLLQETISGKTFELISIYQMLISVRFDASANQTFMPLDQWQKNLNDINLFLDLLKKSSTSYQVSELGKTTDDIDIEPEANADGVKIIFGSISSLIERLDDELTRSLQSTDPHSIEYVERLKDESSIYKLILKGQLYVEFTTPQDKITEVNDQLSRIISRRLDHIYYKPDQLIKSNERDAWESVDASTKSVIASRGASPKELVEGLVDFLSENSTEIYSKKALLSKIYYFAVNNDHKTANELFVSSRIYSTIHNADSSLQIMYNRALVQLGLSAFRVGLIEESQLALNEIAYSQRSKELLGQGFNTKYPSQATVSERQKLLPFHMHINLELLECVNMTSSLLIEIPALAQSSSSTKDSKRKASARSFKNKLEFHDRQYLTGPPESIKDHIIHASKALQKGDWSKAYNLLASIKVWKLFPNNAELLEMMKHQLQVEGLRTYIFTYKSVYTKLSVDLLSTNFKLEDDKVVSILNKMIESGDINASLSEDKKFINFSSNETQRTRLQELAIILNEKVGLLTEKNEKTAYHGRGRKSHQQNQDGQQRDQNKEQTPQQQSKDQREPQEEYVNRFRLANVNSNNDEFQATA
ncbi:Translation initiation factor 3 subunit c [Yamadazyma tenuis]|uniref:Eukaryotic translation initiation factor 3 subunit C n=1 Tax=Candida tenuis (strain ATCC 10573 / BCRC 21748 / CBS 615 / JCM 9827 / NBRC 10315 / NRRL Y-1498 / VKM Y-70) TaxID=590646 RepID=G3B8P6_CANTC|nr:uncharacterized protein CANTEDRAFT_107268 [Yamadazyma tenuis ATCC 10573]EGV62405.1 hypothetical protein CANTEDRAFT_107268 [Yamadazyma tenuis ATCC 10573]WEJ93673.1 Translation initiation factor 3 subunit c [Yamadazyma tenuis]